MSTTTLDVRELLARVVVRQPTLEHDGRSGARLERGVLDDGRRVVIKWSDPRTDLTGLVASGAENRELQLWASGVLDRLPRGVAHAVLGAGLVGDQVVTVMRDLGPHVLSWNDRLGVVDLQRLFGAVASLHETFRGVPPPGLCPLDIRLSLFAPDRLRPHIGSDNPLPALIVRGWEVFAELVPAAELRDARHVERRRVECCWVGDSRACSPRRGRGAAPWIETGPVVASLASSLRTPSRPVPPRGAYSALQGLAHHRGAGR